MLYLTSYISKNKEAAFAQIENDMVILDPETHLFCSVNPTGAALWNLLEHQPLSLSALCEYIHQTYNVSKEDCLKDVSQFIKEMASLKLLTISNDA